MFFKNADKNIHLFCKLTADNSQKEENKKGYTKNGNLFRKHERGRTNSA